MIEAIVGLPVIAIIALVLGGGWASAVPGIPPPGGLGFIFRSWAFAIASTSFVWAWAYPLAVPLTWAVVLTATVGGVGYLVAMLRRSFPDPREIIGSLTRLTIPFAATLFGLAPAMANVFRLSVGQRIGPDAVGYAISTSTLARGLTRPMIEHALVAQVGGGTAVQAVSPVHSTVDSTASFTVQVANEFLTGADRWGLPGAAASVLHMIGPSHLWPVLSLLVGFALFTACTGLWATVEGFTSSRWAATVSVLLLALSPSVLNNWHEGGLAEMWVMPSCIFLVQPILNLGTRPRAGIAAAALVGMLGIFPAMNEDLFAYAALYGLAMIFSIPLLRRTWWSAWWPSLLAASAGAIVVLPSTIAFLSTAVRSASENSNAGWPQPYWPSISEAFGLGNIFNTTSQQSQARGTLLSATTSTADAGVIAFLLALLLRRARRGAGLLLAAVLATGLAVYARTRFLEHASNYQYFKTIAILAPAGALAVGVLLGNALAMSPSRNRADRSILRRHLRPLRIASAVLAIGVFISATTYVVDYRIEGGSVPLGYSALGSSARAQSIFREYNILIPPLAGGEIASKDGLSTIAVGAEVDLNWIGRNAAQVPTRLGARIDHPVAMLVLEQECPGFRCLNKIHGAVVLEQSGVALVRLDRTTAILAKLSQLSWPTWGLHRYLAVGGMPFPGLQL